MTITELHTDVRTCSRCGFEKTVEDFTKDRSRADGLDVWCRSCKSAWKKQDRRNHPEKYRRETSEEEIDIPPEEYLASDSRMLTIPEHVSKILTILGENPTREGLLKTPVRVERALAELTSGYDNIVDATTFDAEGADQMVCQWNIPTYSLCEHHILPFVGYTHIGYIPRERVVGLSKFKRVVDMYARRLQIQERMTRQICDFFEEALKPRGVMVVVEAEHFCMTMRGVQAPGTLTTTSAVTGDFAKKDEGSREEFLTLLNRNRKESR